MKYKQKIIFSLFAVIGGLGCFGYLKWKNHKEFLELVRTSVVSKQHRYVSEMLTPYLGFRPELRQIAVVAILDSAKIEGLEKIPLGEKEMLVRYRLSILSEAGVRDLSGRFLSSFHAKKFIGADEGVTIIATQVDKAIPRQHIAGELHLSRSEGHWEILPVP